MREVSYYPGCSLEASARDYDESIRGVTEMLDIKLVELSDWNCCGATAGHSLDHRITVNLSARNLGMAIGAPQPVVVPCALCFNRLKTAQANLAKDKSMIIDEITKHGTDYDAVEVVELNTFLTSPDIIELAKEKMVFELTGLKPVCYYGCQGQRPPKVTHHPDYENPMGLDNMMAALGADVKDWAFKTDCCGASHSMSRPDILHKLVSDLYNRALEVGANCVVTGCQMCQANLDLYQEDIKAGMGKDVYLPVFTFTELMGLALGHKDTSVWMSRLMTSPKNLLTEIEAPKEVVSNL